MSNDVRTLATISELRHGIIDLIKTANIPGIGNNVFESRSENIWPEEESLACVYTSSTSFDDKRTSPRFYFCVTEVTVNVFAQGENAGNNDFVDEASKKIVEALQPVEKSKGPFSGAVKRFVLKAFANNFSGKAETDKWQQAISFSAEWCCCVTYGGPADDFLRTKNELRGNGNSENPMKFKTEMR